MSRTAVALVALVARDGASRDQISKYLRDTGYQVFECEGLSIPSRSAGIVIVDDHASGEIARPQVESWLRVPRIPRIVVVSARPAGWKTLARTHSACLFVLPAPAFGWEIVDALRTRRDVTIGS
jgi:hypothetical protein